MESIHHTVQELRHRHPTFGARKMVRALRDQYRIRVPEYVTCSPTTS